MGRTAKADSGRAAPAHVEPPGDDMEASFRLAIGELQPGVGGEVVLFNDSAFRCIVLESGGRPYRTGGVRKHVTAEGIDVSGFRYVAFQDGLTVYHSADVDLLVVDL